MRAGLGALLFGGVGGARRVKWGTGGGRGTWWAGVGRIKKTPSGVDGSTDWDRTSDLGLMSPTL